MNRYAYFAIAILLGLSLGLYYGWELSPLQLVDTAPDILRQDYKADYVLMVAEIYQSEGNPEAALQRIAFFPETNPLAAIRDALEFGLDNGYTAEDLAVLNALNETLRAYAPDPEATSIVE
jgi:hypothetical protein